MSAGVIALDRNESFTAGMTRGEGVDESSVQLEALRAEWPDWRIRTSASGAWRATRQGPPLTIAQLGVGLAETLMADVMGDLVAQLEEQRELAGDST
jgi:hypothetical protein